MLRIESPTDSDFSVLDVTTGYGYQMFPPLLLALILVPLAEIYVLIQVKDRIGLPLTIVSLLAVSVLGAWLLKREGLATWRRLRDTLRRGAMPTAEVADGAMILFGGALMLTPGFITDIFGLLLILPPTRASFKGVFRRFVGGWFLTRSGMAAKVGRGAYAARVVRSRRDRATEKTAPAAPASLERPDAADDSPRRG